MKKTHLWYFLVWSGLWIRSSLALFFGCPWPCSFYNPWMGLSGLPCFIVVLFFFFCFFCFGFFCLLFYVFRLRYFICCYFVFVVISCLWCFFGFVCFIGMY